MLKNLRTNNTCSNYPFYALVLFILFLFSCKKVNDVEPENPVEFSYEVDCDNCDIIYVDLSKQNQIIKSNKGKWVYKINVNTPFDLKLSIKTNLSSAQNILAYILKSGEVIYGSNGYNFAEISYNTHNGNGTSNFGTYIGSGSDGGNKTDGNPTPISSICGAKNKSGGSCKRIVAGGGRCWQHK